MAMHRDFALGYVLGQTNAYVESVATGAKLAAQIGCASEHVEEVVRAAKQQGCEVVVENREYGRAAVWIFRLPFVRGVIAELSRETTPPTTAGVWAMGKLFGYADSEIGNYLAKTLGEFLDQNPVGSALRTQAVRAGSEDVGLVKDLSVRAGGVPILASLRCRGSD